MKNMARAFIAVNLTAPMRADLSKLMDKLAKADADVKWVEPHNLHITLKFLGEVSYTETAQVCRAAGRAAETVEPFSLTLGGVGAFPKIEKPRTLWVGVDEGSEPLCKLQEAVEKQMAKLGYRPEAKRYIPHITIGRARYGGGIDELSKLLTEYEAFAIDEPVMVRELIVYSSELTKNGPVYESIGKLPLKK